MTAGLPFNLSNNPIDPLRHRVAIRVEPKIPERGRNSQGNSNPVGNILVDRSIRIIWSVTFDQHTGLPPLRVRRPTWIVVTDGNEVGDCHSRQSTQAHVCHIRDSQRYRGPGRIKASGGPRCCISYQGAMNYVATLLRSTTLHPSSRNLISTNILRPFQIGESLLRLTPPDGSDAAQRGCATPPAWRQDRSAPVHPGSRPAARARPRAGRARTRVRASPPG